MLAVPYVKTSMMCSVQLVWAQAAVESINREISRWGVHIETDTCWLESIVPPRRFATLFSVIGQTSSDLHNFVYNYAVDLDEVDSWFNLLRRNASTNYVIDSCTLANR